MIRLPLHFSFFFFNDTATTEIYTLSLHDALPIWNGSSNRSTGDERSPSGAGVLLDRRSVSADGLEAARAAVLGKPVPLLESRQEPFRQPGVPAARDRADHARQAPALHREIHDRGGAPEDRAVSAQRGAQAGGAPGARDPDGQGSACRAQVDPRYSRGERVSQCRGALTARSRSSSPPTRPPPASLKSFPGRPMPLRGQPFTLWTTDRPMGRGKLLGKGKGERPRPCWYTFGIAGRVRRSPPASRRGSRAGPTRSGRWTPTGRTR